MRLQELMGMLEGYFTFALLAVIALGIILLSGYFIVYKIIFKGKRSINTKKLILLGLLIGYILMVIGVTFLNRGSHFLGHIDLSFFKSYREAWYNFSVRHWQFVILNIIMFVPLGILLPLVHARFRSAAWTIGSAFLFTLLIETFQLITGYGIFELDDLFNNLLGGIIGYGIVMGILSIKNKEIKRVALYFSPLLFVTSSFLIVFSYYHYKEFGNLDIVPVGRVDMSEVSITNNVKLSEDKITTPVFLAPSYTKKEADGFVSHFFENLNVDTSDMEVIAYPSEGVYWSKDRFHNIWFRYLDGSYRYIDYSSHTNESSLKDVGEGVLIKNLKDFGIDIPEGEHFQKLDTGIYEWPVLQKVVGNQLIDGSLTVEFYDDDRIKAVDNRLVTYEKVKDVQVKSKQDAYNEVIAGQFQYYNLQKAVSQLHIHEVNLEYHLDSKGFYQPVYAFETTIDGTDLIILIPAI